MPPARSTTVTLFNDSIETLTLHTSHLDHGIWQSGGEPPQTIAPHATVTWGSESSGVMTGDQGHAIYRLLKGWELRLEWDTPYGQPPWHHPTYTQGAFITSIVEDVYATIAEGEKKPNRRVLFTLRSKLG